MKILFLCNSLNIGGIETYILRFSKWIMSKHSENSLHLICKSGTFGSYENDYLNAGVTLHSMKMRYINPLRYLRFFKFLIANKYDVICDFSGDFGALPIMTAYAAKIQKRMSFYRNARNSYKPATYKIIYQKLLNRIVFTFSTNILSNSEDAFDYYYVNYNRKMDKRFQVVRNGIPIAEIMSSHQKNVLRGELGVLPEQRIVLHVGRGRMQKNHKVMLMIARQAQSKNENTCFCFVGHGVKQRYGSLARHLGLVNVKFCGVRRDVHNIMQIADVFLFPSLYEGHPNALHEAIMNGIPFIASNIASIRESLHPRWGKRWLFDPANHEEGYAILKEHLHNNYKQYDLFENLVNWCKDKYNEEKRYGQLYKIMSM